MEIAQIQIHEAKKKLDEKSCMFVDIRDPGSYRQAHIPGAIQLHDGVLLPRQQQFGRDGVSDGERLYQRREHERRLRSLAAGV